MEVSIVGYESFMPKNEVGNDFFDIDPKRLQRGMFAGAHLRRHVDQETCSEMLVHATRKLIDRFALDVEADIDLILTNVNLGDQFFSVTALFWLKRSGQNPNSSTTWKIRAVCLLCTWPSWRTCSCGRAWSNPLSSAVCRRRAAAFIPIPICAPSRKRRFPAMAVGWRTCGRGVRRLFSVLKRVLTLNTAKTWRSFTPMAERGGNRE